MIFRNIAVAFVAFLLYVTNPSVEDFNRYIVGSPRFDKEEGALVGSWARSLSNTLLSSVSSQADLFFFSVFSVDTSKLRLFEESLPHRVRFFGIAGKFFPIPGASFGSNIYVSPGLSPIPASVEVLPGTSTEKDCFRTGCSPAELDRALRTHSIASSRASQPGRFRENGCFRTGCSPAELESASR